MNLDDVCAFHLAQVRSAASLIDTQERFERVQCAAMDVEVVRQEFAHGGALARLVDGGCVPGAEE